MNTLLQFAQSSYDYTTTTSANTLDAGTAGAMSLGMVLFIVVSSIVIYVITSFLLSKIFKKAGLPSWTAWVPYFNSWKLLEIGGQKGFWAILALIPFINVVAAVFMYISMYHIGLKLGKSGTFILWAIFFPIVWFIWLAVDKSVWNNTLGAPSLAVEHTAPAPGYAPTPMQ